MYISHKGILCYPSPYAVLSVWFGLGVFEWPRLQPIGFQHFYRRYMQLVWAPLVAEILDFAGLGSEEDERGPRVIFLVEKCWIAMLGRGEVAKKKLRYFWIWREWRHVGSDTCELHPIAASRRQTTIVDSLGNANIPQFSVRVCEYKTENVMTRKMTES